MSRGDTRAGAAHEARRSRLHCWIRVPQRDVHPRGPLSLLLFCFYCLLLFAYVFLAIHFYAYSLVWNHFSSRR